MSNDEILALELKLLCLRYGRDRVLHGLAVLDGIDVSALKREISELRNRPKRSGQKRKGKPSVEELLDEASVSPECKPLLEHLTSRYLAKEFLPHLRDVKRLLESHGVAARNVKSRESALAKVINLLAGFPSHELRQLVESRDEQRGDLGILTDQILGRH